MKKEEIKANTIYYTTNYETLEEVVRKTDEIKNSDLLKSEFILRLGIYVTNKSGLVMVTFNKSGKMNSCMVISRHIDGLGQYAWLDFCWCDKHYPQLMRKYQDEITKLCQYYGVERVQARTNRSIKALNRKYGFCEIAKIIERKV